MIVSNYCRHHCLTFSVALRPHAEFYVLGKARDDGLSFGESLDLHLSQFGWKLVWLTVDFEDRREFWYGVTRKLPAGPAGSPIKE